MTKKSVSYAHEKSNKNWSGFIRCDLTIENKAHFGVWSDEHDIEACMTELLDTALELKMKVTIAFNEGQKTWMASLTGGEATPPRFGKWTLTGWGGTWERAVQALLFKHLVVLESNWTVGQADYEAPRDRSYFG